MLTFKPYYKNIMDIQYSYCSDRYQYTMAKSFWDNNKDQQIAVFNLFYRKAPEHNNWAVVSGIDEVLDMIANIGKEDAAFFKKFLRDESYSDFCEYLSKLKFTGNVYAMQEGEIVFPNQPIIIIEAPLIEAQILETPMLCIMNHQMAVATKASRVCRATDKDVFEFGARRAHGPWAAKYGAKAAIIAGCKASSNILNEINYGIKSVGTMAHSYISSFGCSVKSEYEAFSKYINSHKGENISLLIDTYDSLNCGLINAIKAFKDNNIDDDYKAGYSIRLDSGDLAYISIKARELLDRCGLKKCKIIASNSLDEYLIMDLERQGAAIDCYGVGDAIATSKEEPCFGNVYKLVQIDNQALLKRSEDKIKLINPGFQLTYRLMQVKDGKTSFIADVSCLKEDNLAKAIIAGESITIHDEYDQYKKTKINQGEYSYKILQAKVIEKGHRIKEQTKLEDKCKYYKENLYSFSPSEIRLTNPHFYKVDISDDLIKLKCELIESLNKEIEELKLDID